MWIRTWAFKLPLCENCTPQVSHLCGLSPVWIRTWDFKLHLSDNCAPQISHLYGFSHVWIRICVFSLWFHKKCFPQMSHLSRVSMVPVFTFTDILKILLLLTCFYSAHLCSNPHCIKHFVAIAGALVCDCIILCEMCKPHASHLKFLISINESIKMQVLKHFVSNSFNIRHF